MGIAEVAEMVSNEKPESEVGGGGDMEDIEDMAKGLQAGFPNRELRSSVSYKSRKNISTRRSSTVKLADVHVSSDGLSGNYIPGSQVCIDSTRLENFAEHCHITMEHVIILRL